MEKSFKIICANFDFIRKIMEINERENEEEFKEKEEEFKEKLNEECFIALNKIIEVINKSEIQEFIILKENIKFIINLKQKEIIKLNKLIDEQEEVINNQKEEINKLTDRIFKNLFRKK